MVEEYKKPNLLDLVDKKFLQEFQANFAQTTGLACVILDKNGFITEPSNFTDFCLMMKGDEKIKNICSKCDLEKREIGFEKHEPFSYTCHAGLTNFMVPIVVQNQTIALIVAGQIFTKSPEETFYKQLAKEYSVDEKEYLKKVKMIKISTKNKLDAASKLLSQIANSISNMAHQNYQLQEKSKRGTLLNDIIAELGSTLDYNQIRKTLVTKLGDAMGSDFNVLYVFNPKTQRFNPVDEYSLYLTTDEIESPIGINILEDYGWGDLARSGELPDVFYSDIEDLKKDYNLHGTEKEEFLIENKIKSAFYMSIKHAGKLVGMLALNYTKDYKTITQDDINLIKAVASQAGVALYQANLYKENQLQMEREILRRKVVEILRSSLDLKKVKQDITEAIGKAFNADRCYFRAYDKVKDEFLAVDVEYLSSNEVKSLIGEEPNQESLRFFMKEVQKQNKGFYPIAVDKEFAKGTPLEDYMNKAGIAADYAIPIVDRYDELNWFVLHYAKKDPNLSDEDKKLLESIAYQIATAFEQIKLFEQEKQTAQREILLRNISSAIRKSLNLEETFSVICSELSKITGANRVTITQSVDAHENHLIRGEFKQGKEIKSASEMSLKARLNVFKYLTTSVFKSNKPLFVTNIEESDAPDYMKDFYNKLNVKSLVVLPIEKENDAWGILTISHVGNYKHWSQSEIDFLEAVVEQIYTAINQAKLYEETLLRAKRENIIRKIIEKIRSSLSIDDTLKFICEETARFLNVQRSSIIVFPEKNNYMKFELKKEYKESDSINGYVKIAGIERVAEYWGTMLLKNKVHAIDNIIESEAPDYFKNSYNAMGVKSIVGTIIGDKNDIWGDLILSEYNNFRHWTDEEKEFLKTISQQVYIAINQAELYSNMQQQNAREKAILTNLPFLVWLKDIKGKFLAVNEPFANACGFKADDLIGKTDYDIWPKELADSYVNDDKDVMQRRQTKSVEELIQGDDKSKWHETYKTPIYNDKGEVIGTTGFARDITEKMEAQEKIIKAAERETLLRNIIETVRSTLDINKMKKQIVTEVGKAFNAERCVIQQFNLKVNKFDIIDEFSEYVSSDNLKSYVGIDIEKPGLKFFRDMFAKGEEMLVPDWQEHLDKIEEVDMKTKEWIKSLDIKSDYVFPIVFGGQLLASLYFTYTSEKKYLSEEDLTAIRTLTNQIAIGFHQAQLYEAQKLAAEREKLLRKITETIRQTLNVNETKKTIVTEIGKALNADIAYIVTYDSETNTPRTVDEYSEYRADESAKSLVGYDFSGDQLKFLSSFHSQNKPIYMQNADEFIKENNLSDTGLERWIREENIKSAIGMSMSYGGKIFGVLAVHYNKAEYPITTEYVDFFMAISEQAGIALYQAKLYEKIQTQAEREKMSRNIIEILRSSIDKSIIKKLFVKNLGKFFNADRVFLSEYNFKTNIFMPVDSTSEYLSSEDEKTATNYDFTSPEFNQHVEALLEKREIKIYDFDEFVQQNHGLDEKMIEHYKEVNTKSIYAFPIIYQEHIMGAFAIQFTHQIVKLSDEDLGRIRSICTQAGIALYHANLYEKAQECEISRRSYMSKVAKKLEQPVHEILDISTLLTQNEFEHFIEVEYLNKIIGSCNYLLELTAESDED